MAHGQIASAKLTAPDLVKTLIKKLGFPQRGKGRQRTDDGRLVYSSPPSILDKK